MPLCQGRPERGLPYIDTALLFTATAVAAVVAVVTTAGAARTAVPVTPRDIASPFAAPGTTDATPVIDNATAPARSSRRVRGRNGTVRRIVTPIGRRIDLMGFGAVQRAAEGVRS